MNKRDERQRFEKILNRFPKTKVLVIGDIMLDRFIWGKVSRISPEAPVPVVLVDNNDNELFHLGGAANVANNIHSLGGHVLLCGVVGNDVNGDRIREALEGIGIPTDGIFEEKGRQTTVKTRIFANQQQVVRIDRETIEHPGDFIARDIWEFLSKKIEECDAVIISDYEKGLLTRRLIRPILQKAKRLKKGIMVDPKPKNFYLYKGATLITPNTKEASEASGIPITDESSLRRVGRKLLKKLECEALVITRGEEGMAIFEPHREFFVRTVAKEVYDVTGAGDTVIGTVTLGLTAGASVIDAVRLANYAAGIVVGKRGTATANREELIKAIRED
jgi:D-beta-D-heptose 7-phosphate kinase/D-beta-D-heptose 1-phosphate adenosyltransferase